MVVDKPAGLLTAPTPESDRGNLLSLLNRREKGVENVQVVHRLDLPTSGLIAFSKSDLALRVLTERFRQHDLERVYLAVVAGIFPGRIALIDQPIERRPARTRVAAARTAGNARDLPSSPARDRPHPPDPTALPRARPSGARGCDARTAEHHRSTASGAARHPPGFSPPAYLRAAGLGQPVAARSHALAGEATR